ncbi:MAG: succinoglycan biosynthesis protein [Microgenomates group bacterium Gr01-1014_16]|nr:MAG: succinoglycan biosynthesis protein [Microgenomates group bacterium Gr01-1014_16]
MKTRLPKSKGDWKTAVAVGATALIASGGLWWIGDRNKIPVPAYKMLRVIDGDTFETTERQLIRLSGVNAPELANCYGQEAKSTLQKLITNKNLYLKVIYRDGSNRLISHVYTDKGLVATQLAREGTVYDFGRGLDDPEFDQAVDYAKSHKIGIFSPKCTQTINTANPKCAIKGNVRTPDSKLYRFPGCGNYTTTLVQLSLDDRWFCTEKEAQSAGFSKGSDCFNQSWK